MRVGLFWNGSAGPDETGNDGIGTDRQSRIEKERKGLDWFLNLTIRDKMNLTNEEKEELKKLAKPLNEWLHKSRKPKFFENYNPEIKIIIDHYHVCVLETIHASSLCRNVFEKFQ